MRSIFHRLYESPILDDDSSEWINEDDHEWGHQYCYDDKNMGYYEAETQVKWVFTHILKVQNA